MKNKNVRILSLKLEPLTEKEARARISKILTDFPKNGRCAKIYTPNPQIALGCASSKKLTKIFRRADILLPDGIGIIMASKLLGTPLPERITGIDTAEFVMKKAASLGLSVAFLGAQSNVGERASKNIQSSIYGSNVVFTHHGYFDKSGEENERIIKALRSASPDILFVCFGFPEQEKWIDKNADRIPSLRLCMGLGGALDVWSGDKKRAPVLIRSVGLEWLWRTLGDRKKRRCFSDISRFILAIFTQKTSKKH